MAMRACQCCKQNTWNFKKFGFGIIQATCNHCGHQVEWEAKEKKITGKNDICPECDEPLYKEKSKITPKKLMKKYYFTHVMKCRKCKKTFVAERFKVYNKPEPESPILDAIMRKQRK